MENKEERLGRVSGHAEGRHVKTIVDSEAGAGLDHDTGCQWQCSKIR